MIDGYSSEILYYKGKLYFIKEEKELSFNSGYAAIGYLSEGEMWISGADIKEKKMLRGEMVLFPPDIHSRISSVRGCTLLILEIPNLPVLCHQFLSASLYQQHPTKEELFYMLTVSRCMQSTIDTTELYINQGIADSRLLQIKTWELFYFIKASYSEEYIQQFFSSILSERYIFTHFVLSNYMSVKTVEELAQLSNYSLSGFEKQFRKTFNIAPYKWMLQKKVQSIYRDISETTKPLKIIAEEYDFATLSRLTDFCRRHLGMTPSAIRGKRKK